MDYDKERAKENARLSTVAVLALLEKHAPEVWRRAEVVGRWVWVTFDEKPCSAVRDTLRAIGFRWNHKRQCWLHPCGSFRRYSRGTPREKYAVTRTAGCAEAEAAA